MASKNKVLDAYRKKTVTHVMQQTFKYLESNYSTEDDAALSELMGIGTSEISNWKTRGEVSLRFLIQHMLHAERDWTTIKSNRGATVLTAEFRSQTVALGVLEAIAVVMPKSARLQPHAVAILTLVWKWAEDGFATDWIEPALRGRPNYGGAEEQDDARKVVAFLRWLDLLSPSEEVRVIVPEIAAGVAGIVGIYTKRLREAFEYLGECHPDFKKVNPG
jgi:hypothetical protein